MGRTNLGAKELCNQTETTLHSHPGGGNGAVIKSGQSTGAKATEVQVDFASAFLAIPRIALSPYSAHIVWITEVTVNYFKWKNNSKNVGVTVDWIAIEW